MRENHFKLKKPYKGKGLQTIRVLPGEEIVIVCRAANEPLKTVKFPPEMDINIESLQ